MLALPLIRPVRSAQGAIVIYDIRHLTAVGARGILSNQRYSALIRIHRLRRSLMRAIIGRIAALLALPPLLHALVIID